MMLPYQNTDIDIEFQDIAENIDLITNVTKLNLKPSRGEMKFGYMNESNSTYISLKAMSYDGEHSTMPNYIVYAPKFSKRYNNFIPGG